MFGWLVGWSSVWRCMCRQVDDDGPLTLYHSRLLYKVTRYKRRTGRLAALCEFARRAPHGQMRQALSKRMPVEERASTASCIISCTVARLDVDDMDDMDMLVWTTR